MAGKLQFSVRHILAAMAAAAIILAVLNAEPGKWYAGLSLVLCSAAIPAVLFVATIKLRGYSQAFCLGALVPACACLSAMANVLPWVIDHAGTLWTWQFVLDCLQDVSELSLQFSFGLYWSFMPFCGLLGIATAWLIGRPHDCE